MPGSTIMHITLQTFLSSLMQSLDAEGGIITEYGGEVISRDQALAQLDVSLFCMICAYVRYICIYVCMSIYLCIFIYIYIHALTCKCIILAYIYTNILFQTCIKHSFCCWDYPAKLNCEGVLSAARLQTSTMHTFLTDT